MQTFFHWAPRLLSLLFVGWLALFALDVFNEHSGQELVIALVIHLLPALTLLVGTAVAWRYSLFGTLIFLGFAVWYVLEAGLDRPWAWYVLIMGPALFVALLYLVDWHLTKWHKEEQRQD